MSKRAILWLGIGIIVPVAFFIIFRSVIHGGIEIPAGFTFSETWVNPPFLPHPLVVKTEFDCHKCGKQVLGEVISNRVRYYAYFSSPYPFGGSSIAFVSPDNPAFGHDQPPHPFAPNETHLEMKELLCNTFLAMPQVSSPTGDWEVAVRYPEHACTGNGFEVYYRLRAYVRYNPMHGTDSDEKFELRNFSVLKRFSDYAFSRLREGTEIPDSYEFVWYVEIALEK